MTGPTGAREPGRERLGVLLASLAAAGLVVVFSGKPFHIDDPYFLQAAQHVARDPLHPLDFGINLDDRTRPAREVFASPPGFFYFLALLLRLGIEGERGIHFALAPFAGLLVWSTGRLASALGQRPLLPSVLVACSPAAMVCANTVMPDSFAASTAALGAALWLEGEAGRHRARLLGGGVLMALASFSRYGAVAAPAALGVFALLRRVRDPIAWASLLLSPAVALLWTQLAGGGEALASLTEGEPTRLHAARALATFAHLGLATAPALAGLLGGLGPAARSLGLGLLLVAPLVLLRPEVYRMHPALQVLLPGAIGAAFTVRVLASALRDRGALAERASDALLASWLAFTLVLPVLYVHASAKYLVPALPAIALAAGRLAPLRAAPRFAIAVLFLGLGLAAALADYRLARAHRDLAQRVVGPLAEAGRRVWFAGHWGFQWYAGKVGGLCFEAEGTIERGDFLAYTEIAFKTGEPAPREGSWVAVRTEAVADAFPFRTMSPAANAGFYSHAYGLLPFGWSAAPVEVVRLVEAR